MTTMLSMIEGLPDQYRWAAALDTPAPPTAPSAVICGMGGSGISGDFARMVAAVDGVDVRVHKDYGLPAWIPDARPLVIAVSYSGTTSETLSSVEAAHQLGLPIAVVSTGGLLGSRALDEGWPAVATPEGLQPRAALGYLVGAVLRLLGRAGIVSDPTGDLLEAAEECAGLLGTKGDGPGHSQARRLAATLAGRLVAIWGSAGPTSVVAQRWAKQAQENAKLPAYWSTLPELDHNELVPWATPNVKLKEATGIVLLRDRGERAEIARRFDLTAELIGDNALLAGEVWTHGESVLARAATGSLIGDLVSVYLAEAAGIDPVSVDILTELKNRL